MTDQRAEAGPHQAGDKPPAGTPVIVDVLAKTADGGGVKFTHNWRWQNGSPGGGDGTIEVPKRGKDEAGTPIHFHLKDDTDPKRGLDYTDDIQGAMWVKRDSCPDEHSIDDEIPADQMNATPNLLKVFNKNSEDCTLHYRLRFKDKDGNPESYDPDIKNGGTGLGGGDG